jgi:hypothetical protein
VNDFCKVVHELRREQVDAHGRRPDQGKRDGEDGFECHRPTAYRSAAERIVKKPFSYC